MPSLVRFPLYVDTEISHFQNSKIRLWVEDPEPPIDNVHLPAPPP